MTNLSGACVDPWNPWLAQDLRTIARIRCKKVRKGEKKRLVGLSNALHILMRQAVGNKKHPSCATLYSMANGKAAAMIAACTSWAACCATSWAANLLLPGAYLLGFVALVCCLGLRVFARASWPRLLAAFPSFVSRLDRLLCLRASSL